MTHIIIIADVIVAFSFLQNCCVDYNYITRRDRRDLLIASTIILLCASELSLTAERVVILVASINLLVIMDINILNKSCVHTFTSLLHFAQKNRIKNKFDPILLIVYFIKICQK